MDKVTLPAFANPKKLPHQRPEISGFELAMEKLNLESESEILLYAGKGCFAVPRTWYLFKYFGLQNVWIIEGGLEAWKEGGGRVEDGPGNLDFPDVTSSIASLPPQTESGAPKISTSITAHTFVDMDYVNVQSTKPDSNKKILDARSAARFYNKEGASEREGVRKGHMPNR